MSIMSEAKLLTKQFSQKEIEDQKNQLLSVNKQIEDVQILVENLTFGCEKIAKEKAEKLLSNLKDQKSQIDKIIFFGKDYQLFSLEPFKWRNDKAPSLVLFSLDDPYFVESNTDMQNNADTQDRPKLPRKIRSLFRDLNDNWKIMRCSLECIIPAKIKEKIEKVKSSFEDIFIVAEPIIDKKVPSDPDPFVVGWDGINLWLIDSFDITPIEKLALWSSGIATE